MFAVFKMWGHASLLGNTVVLFISHRLYGVLLAEQCIGFNVPIIHFMDCSLRCHSGPQLLPDGMLAGVEGHFWDFHEARGCSLKWT